MGVSSRADGSDEIAPGGDRKERVLQPLARRVPKEKMSVKK
jgi:hypothetical protein